MNIVEICQYRYPGQIDAGNITFCQPESDILIATWSVPNEPQPTEKELVDYGIANARAININILKNEAIPSMQIVIDKVARDKGYDNGISCATYVSSSNAQWSSEASTFVAWRDSVWEYGYTVLATLQGSQDPIPTLEEFMAALPVIVWPN